MDEGKIKVPPHLVSDRMKIHEHGTFGFAGRKETMYHQLTAHEYQKLKVDKWIYFVVGMLIGILGMTIYILHFVINNSELIR